MVPIILNNKISFTQENNIKKFLKSDSNGIIYNPYDKPMHIFGISWIFIENEGNLTFLL